MSKYHAKPTVVDGIRFDSKKEANYYLILRDREQKGLICGLALQPTFELLPAQYVQDGKKRKCIFRSIHYKADFRYYDNALKEMVVVDVKGFKTPVYKLKKALMYHTYGILIKEV